MTLAYMQIDHIAFVAIAIAGAAFWLVTKISGNTKETTPSSVANMQRYSPTISSLPASIAPSMYDIADVIAEDTATVAGKNATGESINGENSNRQNSPLIKRTQNTTYLKAPLVIKSVSPPRNALKPAEPLQPKPPVPARAALVTVKQRKR